VEQHSLRERKSNTASRRAAVAVIELYLLKNHFTWQPCLQN
jgi:hypothetical protein